MGEMKPTPGRWIVRRSGGDEWYFREGEMTIVREGDEYDAIAVMSACAQTEAHFNLFAEALNVREEVGLSPVQLVEQRDELLAACKKLVEWEAREKDHAIGFMERINLCEVAFQMMYAALAKCEGVK
ncbi:hypothetical protein [Acidovorax sp.]|uniref:hypothetical protein n=1 Tax=Acidovorax sp. TaxID=1872122 RepID=UPI0031DDD82C